MSELTEESCLQILCIGPESLNDSIAYLIRINQEYFNRGFFNLHLVVSTTLDDKAFVGLYGQRPKTNEEIEKEKQAKEQAEAEEAEKKRQEEIALYLVLKAKYAEYQPLQWVESPGGYNWIAASTVPGLHNPYNVTFNLKLRTFDINHNDHRWYQTKESAQAHCERLNREAWGAYKKNH